MDSRGHFQKIKKEKNQKIIIELIRKEEMSFTQLSSKVPFSQTTLTKHLKILSKNKNIVKGILNGNEVYKLTKKGKKSFSDLFNLVHDMEKIRTRGGKHFRDYSYLHVSMLGLDVPWGIESDLTLDKELCEEKLLTRKDVSDIEEFIFKKFVKNLKKKELSEDKSGEIVLGFSIDYNKLLKSIKEDSLAYSGHMSKEEIDLRHKWSEHPDIVTSRELKRLQELRKKTFEKIKKLHENDK